MRIKGVHEVDYSKLIRRVDLIVPAQSAKMGPPVGPILGQVKVKIKDFCAQFNEYTQKYKIGLPLRVFVFVYKNETFHFIVKTPATSFLIRNLLEYEKKNSLSLLDIYKIMLVKKMDDVNLPNNLLFRSILANVRSMNIKIH